MKTQTTVFDLGPLLPMVLLLAGLVTACSQRGVVSKSVQSTTQSPTSADSTDDPLTEAVFTVVEVPPSFPGGSPGLTAYLRQNLRYPEAARKQKVTGSVFLSFIVTKGGSLREVGVLKGLGFGTDDEALRLVQAMPKWKPGKQSGRPVHVRFILAVPFESGTR
ncbi:MAG: energy transducer TonB [Sphingobacteriaceae bacterium]|nr:energy transducer TonB [Cytophagaceae bacterium]